MLFSIEFDVTVFDVPVFDVTLLYRRDDVKVEKLTNVSFKLSIWRETIL